jgi:hypothetical protein
MNIDPNVLEYFGQHLKSDSLALLQGARIAVDAAHFFSRMNHDYVQPFPELSNVKIATVNEPLMAIMGGPPSTLPAAIKTEIQKWFEAGISPLFVFPGVSPKSSTPTQHAIQNDIYAQGAKEREVAWRALEEGKADWVDMFRKIAHPKLLSEGNLSYAQRYLRQMNVEVLRAPCSSVAQIAYLLKVQAVNAGFASPELTYFEHGTKVIVEIDFDAKKFWYLERQELWMNFTARSLAINQYSNFLDTVLLVSNLPWPSSGPQAVQDASQALAECQGLVGDVVGKRFQTADEVQTKVKWHLRARAIYKHGIILNQECSCVPISEREDPGENTPNIPCNLSDIWGDRVSDVLYYLHSTGALCTSLLTDLMQNCFREHSPMVDTNEYREMLEKIVPLRTQVMFQIINALSSDPSSFFHQRVKMTWFRWFHHRETTVLWPPQITLGEWDVQGHAGSVDFSVVFKYAEKARKSGLRCYTSLNDVVIAVHMKALDLLGYFTHSTLRTFEETSGLSVYSEALHEISVENQESGVLLIEMLRTKSLRGGEPYTTPPPSSLQGSTTIQQSSHRAPPNRALHNLISRVWCLVTPHLSATIPWEHGASRDLSAFLTIVRALCKTLRSLSETLCANLFLTGVVQVDRFGTGATQLGDMLPFSRDPSAHMGLIMDYILRTEEGDITLTKLVKRYPCCDELEKDLRRGFQFWAEVMAMLTVLEQPEKDSDVPVACSDLLGLFRNADVLVQRRRMLLFPT